MSGATTEIRERIRDAAEAAWDRSGGARLANGARSNPRVAIAVAVGTVIVIAWIGWAGYVTGEHGINAGLGVLVAWPAVFGALALIAAPFVGGYLLVRRLRGSEPPPIAGGADGSGSAGDPEAIPGDSSAG